MVLKDMYHLTNIPKYINKAKLENSFMKKLSVVISVIYSIAVAS